MNQLLLIFVAGFASVFMLGFQSRAVNHGNYSLAFGNSLLIGLTQSNIWALMDVERSWTAAFVYGFSGACGITFSMWVHQRYFTGGKNGRQDGRDTR